MNINSSKLLSGFKYVYLIVFFALLSGFFHPIITETGFESVIVGIIVLFIGLAGIVLIIKFTTVEKRPVLFLGGGLALIAISLMYIFQITGRV